MINSLLLYFSCYRTKKYLNFMFFIFWLINFLVVKRDSLNQVFTFINLFVFLIVMNLCLIKKTNKYFAPFSVLIYSVIIDIICFYYFPLFNVNMTIFEYILNGILFNYKFIILPIIFTIGFELFKFIRARKNNRVVFDNYLNPKSV